MSVIAANAVAVRAGDKRCSTASRSRSPRARPSRWSGRTAPANRRCCACSPANLRPPPARSPLKGRAARRLCAARARAASRGAVAGIACGVSVHGRRGRAHGRGRPARPRDRRSGRRGARRGRSGRLPRAHDHDALRAASSSARISPACWCSSPAARPRTVPACCCSTSRPRASTCVTSSTCSTAAGAARARGVAVVAILHDLNLAAFSPTASWCSTAARRRDGAPAETVTDDLLGRVFVIANAVNRVPPTSAPVRSSRTERRGAFFFFFFFFFFF